MGADAFSACFFFGSLASLEGLGSCPFFALVFFLSRPRWGTPERVRFLLWFFFFLSRLQRPGACPFFALFFFYSLATRSLVRGQLASCLSLNIRMSGVALDPIFACGIFIFVATMEGAG